MKVRLLLLLALLLPLAASAQSKYKVNGVDLDSIFAPYHSGWPQAPATGFKVNGADLNGRYAALSSGTAAGVTHFKTSAGVDLNALFAAIGTTGVQIGTQPGNVSGSSAAGNPSGSVTSSSTSVSGSKGGGSYSYTWHIASGSASFTSGSSATTAVTNSAVPAGSTLSGSMYCTISDGVTAANSNTVSWSLQNTSPAEYSGTLVAGESGGGTQTTFYGFNNGSPAFGSLSPATDVNGNTILSLYYLDDVNTGTSLKLGFQQSLASTYFTTMNVYQGGTLVGSYSASSASFSGGSGSTWTWASVSNPFPTNGATYTIQIIY